MARAMDGALFLSAGSDVRRVVIGTIGRDPRGRDAILHAASFRSFQTASEQARPIDVSDTPFSTGSRFEDMEHEPTWRDRRTRACPRMALIPPADSHGFAGVACRARR